MFIRDPFPRLLLDKITQRLIKKLKVTFAARGTVFPCAATRVTFLMHTITSRETRNYFTANVSLSEGANVYQLLLALVWVY